MQPHRNGFTLVELLVVIAIIAVLSVVAVITLNPAALLQQSRDSTRIADMTSLNIAISFYASSAGGSLGTASTTYISIPDPTATSTAGDQCQGLGLPALPSGWAYHCAASSTYRRTDGTGWIPVTFNAMTSGSPLSSLPVDPTNTTSSGLYYAYAMQGNHYEFTSVMESSKFGLNGGNDKVSTDGGIMPDTYEVGNSLALMLPDRGAQVVGEWLWDQGSGTTALDSGIYKNTETQYHGSPTWNASGREGTALNFNGTSDSYDLLSASSPTAKLAVTSGFTLSAWVYPTTDPGTGENMVMSYFKNPSNEDFPYGLQAFDYNASGYPDCYYEQSAGTFPAVNGIAKLPLNTWTHLACTFDGTSLKMYVNSNLVATTNAPGSVYYAAGVYDFIFGNDNAGDTSYLGEVDDARVYNQALSATAVKALYTAGGGH